MASQAKQHRGITGGEFTQVCSINQSGLVFVCGLKLTVSSELSITVQTSTAGHDQDWSVRGLVVECRAVKRGGQARYQVTLLFSEMPEGLGELVADAMNATDSFLPLKNCPLFGMN